MEKNGSEPQEWQLHQGLPKELGSNGTLRIETYKHNAGSVIDISFDNIVVSVPAVNAPEVLETLSVTPPTKTSYTVGEELDLTGMEVTAGYADGSTKEITEGYTVTGYDKAVQGEQTVTISYTENGVEKIATFKVNVNALIPPVTSVPSEGLGLWLKADEGIILDDEGE